MKAYAMNLELEPQKLKLNNLHGDVPLGRGLICHQEYQCLGPNSRLRLVEYLLQLLGMLFRISECMNGHFLNNNQNG